MFFPSGHVLLYIGDGYVVDCRGGKYGTSTGLEAFEVAGGTLTYSVATSNCSNDPDLVTYRRAAGASYAGQTYTGLVVTETIPERTALVEGSISNGGVYENGVITWTLDLAAGEKVERRTSHTPIWSPAASCSKRSAAKASIMSAYIWERASC